jgi:thioredoxin-like negative regulator of GroEL
MASLSEIRHTIRTQPAVMLFFSAPDCGVCHALKPKLKEALTASFPGFEFLTVDISTHPDIAARYGVFTVPTVIVWLDGKEFFRKSRNMSVPALIEEIRRPWELLMG